MPSRDTKKQKRKNILLLYILSLLRLATQQGAYYLFYMITQDFEKKPSTTMLHSSRSISHKPDSHSNKNSRNELQFVEINDSSVGLISLQDQLSEAQDTINDQLLAIESLKDYAIRQQRVVEDFDTENEELIADMQDLIEENEHLLRELESTKASKTKVEAENSQLKSENFILADRLEEKRLGWLEESEVEELKRQTKEPLVRKLEASREEANELAERLRLLDVERDGLAEQLAKALQQNSELSDVVTNMQRTIDELNKAYQQVCQGNSSLKSRIRTFDPDATFQDTYIPHIPEPFKRQATKKRKSIFDLMPSIPAYLFPTASTSPSNEFKQGNNMNNNYRNLKRASVVGVISHPQTATSEDNKGLQRTSFSHMSMPPDTDQMKTMVLPRRISKQHFSSSRRNTFNVFSKHAGNETAIPSKPASSVLCAVNQVQELFAAGELGGSSDEEADGKSTPDAAANPKIGPPNVIFPVRNLYDPRYGDVQSDCEMRSPSPPSEQVVTSQIHDLEEKNILNSHDHIEVEEVTPSPQSSTPPASPIRPLDFAHGVKKASLGLQQAPRYSKSVRGSMSLPRSSPRSGLTASKTMYSSPYPIPSESSPKSEIYSKSDEKAASLIVAKYLNYSSTPCNADAQGVPVCQSSLHSTILNTDDSFTAAPRQSLILGWNEISDDSDDDDSLF